MLLMSFAGMACGRPGLDPKTVPDPAADITPTPDQPTQSAIFAGGCFWCTEAVFEQLAGVTDVVSGYTGGKPSTANYQAVCSGTTAHAEAIRITYDPNTITYGQLLKIFFTVAHNPTQLNRQGPDSGRQYRSAIFYETDEQKSVAQSYILQLEDAKLFDAPIVTTLEPLNEFFIAEAYHQDYARRNPNDGYISQQAQPKIQKTRTKFPNQLKPEP